MLISHGFFFKEANLLLDSSSLCCYEGRCHVKDGSLVNTEGVRCHSEHLDEFYEAICRYGIDRIVTREGVSSLYLFEYCHTRLRSLSSARWHSSNTNLSSLGILGKEKDYFPTQKPLLCNSNLNKH